MVPVGVALHTDDAPSVHQSQSSHALLCRSCHSRFAFCPSKLVISPKLPARQCSITRHCCAMPTPPPFFCREQSPFYFFVPMSPPLFLSRHLGAWAVLQPCAPTVVNFSLFSLIYFNFFFTATTPPLSPFPLWSAHVCSRLVRLPMPGR